MTVLSHVVEHDVAALHGVVGMDAGVVVGGGLEHTHQHGGLLHGQHFRRSAEIGLGGGLDAKGIRAEVNGIGILRQYLLLREEILQLVGGNPLLALHNEHLQSGDVPKQASRIFGTYAKEVLG